MVGCWMHFILTSVVMFNLMDVTTCDCTPQCLQCSDNSTCSSCLSRQGFYRVNDTCPACIENCETCSQTNEEKCFRCEEGFYRGVNNTECHALPRNCRSFDAEKGECTGCRSRGVAYLLKKDKSDCGKCAENCVSCPGLGVGKCDRCQIGYTRTDDFTCKQCPDNCDYCHLKGSFSCEKCRRGYELSAGACSKRACKSGCLCDAADSTRCDICDKGHLSTLDGEGCLPCPAHCDSCSHPDYCAPSGCEKGRRFDPVERLCGNGGGTMRWNVYFLCLFLIAVPIMLP